MEEVKSPGYPTIGPAPLQGHSLSNFKGQRTPCPQSGQGSPSLSRKGWLAGPPGGKTLRFSQVLPPAESGGQRFDTGRGPMGEAGGLGSCGCRFLWVFKVSLLQEVWFFFCPPGRSWFPAPQSTQLGALCLRLLAVLAFPVSTPLPPFTWAKPQTSTSEAVRSPS